MDSEGSWDEMFDGWSRIMWTCTDLAPRPPTLDGARIVAVVTDPEPLGYWISIDEKLGFAAIADGIRKVHLQAIRERAKSLRVAEVPAMIASIGGTADRITSEWMPVYKLAPVNPLHFSAHFSTEPPESEPL